MIIKEKTAPPSKVAPFSKTTPSEFIISVWPQQKVGPKMMNYLYGVILFLFSLFHFFPLTCKKNPCQDQSSVEYNASGLMIYMCISFDKDCILNSSWCPWRPDKVMYVQDSLYEKLICFFFVCGKFAFRVCLRNLFLN